MPQAFISQLDLNQIVITLILTVGGGALVWYRKQLTAWSAFWKGVLNGLRAVPELQSDVRGIRYYVGPNGGGSLMDAVARTEKAVTALTEQSFLIVQTMRAENDSDDEVGRYHSGPDGEHTYVNQTYARWLSVGKPELLGWNYLNFIHPEDVDRVRRHWDQCRLEHRQYRIQFRMVSTLGVTILVRVVATPIPDTRPAVRWIGSIRMANVDSR